MASKKTTPGNPDARGRTDRTADRPAARATSAAQGRKTPTDAAQAEFDRQMRELTLSYHKARNAKAIHEAAVQRGLMIERAMVDQLLGERGAFLKQSLEGLGQKVAPLLDGLSTQERQAAIDDHVRDLLAAWHRIGRWADE